MKKLLYFTFLFLTVMIQAQIPFPQDTIVRNDMFNNRQFALYDLNGKIHISWTGQNGTNSATREIFYAVENPNGTFTTSNVTNNSVDDGYSTTSVDRNNKIHLGWEKRDPTIFQIVYSNNINGTWLDPIFITTGGLNKATPYSKIGPDSVVHFVYFTYVEGNDNAYYRSLRLRDSLLSPELSLGFAEASGDFEATLDIDAAGFVHIALKSAGAISGPLKYFNNTTGNLTEYPTGVGVNVSYPKIALDKQGNPVIIYRSSSIIYVIKRNGSTFSTPIPLSPSGQLPAGFQTVSIDDSNYVYVIWQSSQSASGKGFYMKYGKDNTWSDTIKVYDITPEYVTRNSSQIIARNKGDIAIFYAPGGVRNTFVIADIFMKRGNIFNPVPVELTAFTASAVDKGILLNWTTSTEKNNKGFSIERSRNGNEWSEVSFISGRGTIIGETHYSYTDMYNGAGNLFYRLKQIDFDGTFEYSPVVEVDLTQPAVYSLEQNYPNPFNPATSIRYAVPTAGNVDIELFDILGNRIASLFSGYREPGSYELNLNAGSYNLPSGAYFYRMTASGFTSSRSMIYLK